MVRFEFGSEGSEGSSPLRGSKLMLLVEMIMERGNGSHYLFLDFTLEQRSYDRTRFVNDDVT
jgi:hypothetical protein